MRVGRAGFACLVAVAIACALPEWQPPERRTAPVPGAEPVGAAECLFCHKQVQGHAKIAGYHGDCESCHGPGSVHIDVHVGEADESSQPAEGTADARRRAPLQLPGRLRTPEPRPPDIRYPASQDCLACHGLGRSTHLEWGTGEHKRAGLDCSDCHNPHATTKLHLRQAADVGLLRTLDDASRLCVECHHEVAATFTYPSHHPVAEGALSCLSCHDPHGDQRVGLGGPNQVCAGCHQDLAGPWVFEHIPVEEDCASCHDPHGALSDKLLHTSQPIICLSCHSLNDRWHHDATGSGFLANRTITEDLPTNPAEKIGREVVTFQDRCTNCHGAIHGSYSDEHLRH